MKYLFLLCILTSSIFVSAQKENIKQDSTTSSNKLSLALIYKNYNDKITLRWAPNREDGWITGMNNGYRVDRLTLDKNMEPIGDWDTLYTELIKPYSIEKFKVEIARNPDDNYIAAAAESMYGYQMKHGNKKPDDNLFALAEEFKDRFTFALLSADLSKNAAEGLGWSFTDTHISPGKIYLYRVFVPGDDSISFALDNSVVAVYDSSYLEYPKVSKILEKEKQIDILLNREINDRYFTAYYVERSENNGKNWKRLNKIPFAQPLTDQKNIGNMENIVYRDTGLVNYRPYLYRLRGLTPFGEVSKPSPSKKAMARDKTPPPPPDRFKVVFNDKKQMEITWEYDNMPKDIRGYILGKSKRPYDPIQKIHEGELPPETSHFIDKNPYSGSTNYYTLFVLDTAGNVGYGKSTFGDYIDEEPPKPPTNIKYKIDTNGIVKIWWDMGKEEDLMGYHVYFNNDMGHYLHNVTDTVLQDTFFIDTLDLKSLSEKVYYRITALDVNYNVSGFSTWLIVEKPDLVPPSSPLIVGYKATEKGIRFEIKKSSSTDVVAYELMRSTDGTIWKTINWQRASAIKDFIEDNKVPIQGKLYKYRLLAIDDAKNKSKVAYTITARTRLPVQKGKIEKFDVINKNNMALLKWKYIGRDDDVMKVYRTMSNGEYKLIHSYHAKLNKGKDFTIKKDTAYKYRIVLQSRKGKILDKEVKSLN